MLISHHQHQAQSKMNQSILHSVDHEDVNHVFEDAFGELAFWLLKKLKEGYIVPMKTIKVEYQRIRDDWDEPDAAGILRTASIRLRLISKFGNDIYLFHRSKYDDLDVSL